MGFIPVLTVTAFSVMVGALAGSGTSCFFGCMAGYLGSMAVGIVFPAITPALFTSYMGIGRMVIGSSVPIAGLITGIVVLLAYGAAFLSAAVLRFLSREI